MCVRGRRGCECAHREGRETVLRTFEERDTSSKGREGRCAEGLSEIMGEACARGPGCVRRALLRMTILY